MTQNDVDYRFLEQDGIYSCVYCNRAGHNQDLHHDLCPVTVARQAIEKAS